MMRWDALAAGRGSTATAADPKLAPGPVDLSAFDRQQWLLGDLSGMHGVTLAAYGAGCRPDTPPADVPMAVLDAIGWDPIVDTGEQLVTAPATDASLYYASPGEDPLSKEAAEWVGGWLHPLLTRARNPLLSMITQAYGIGVAHLVLDFEVVDGHAVYVRAHEIWAGEAQPHPDNADRLVATSAGPRVYGGEDHDDPGQRRAYAAVWRPHADQTGIGLWRGRGSRRRVHRAWIEGGMTDLWNVRYLERGVDPARVGFAPDGNLSIGGQEVSALKILRAQTMSLRNGSTIALPGTYDDRGNRLWDLRTLEIPDRSAAFSTAIDSFGRRKLWGSGIPGGLDKATEDVVMDAMQSVADFCAQTLTRVIQAPLLLRYGPQPPAVSVLANTVKKRKAKVTLEVWRTVAGMTQRLSNGKVYTLGELVHPEIVEDLGIRARSVEEAAHEPAAEEATAEIVGAPGGGRPGSGGQPGPARDQAGEREERRERGKTDEGEEDTGSSKQEREERE